MTIGKSADFEVRLARTQDELRAAQRLRYDVFVSELTMTSGLRWIILMILSIT